MSDSDSSDLSDGDDYDYAYADEVVVGQQRAQFYEQLAKAEVADEQGKKKTLSNVFSNELVLEKIFEKLRLGDLRRCRLVNRAWSRAANKVIISKWNTYVHIDLRDATGVKELSRLLAKGDKYLPFGGVHLRWSGSNNDGFSYNYCNYDYNSKPDPIPLLWKKLVLMERHFDQFKRVRLEVVFDELSFFDYLFEGPFKNVEHLELVQVKKKDSKQRFGRKQKTVNKNDSNRMDDSDQDAVKELSLDDWNLANLRSIIFNRASRCDGIDTDFLIKLLKSSPNLQEIRGLPTSACLSAVIDAKKFDTVMDLKFCGCFGTEEEDKPFQIPASSVTSFTVYKGYHGDESSDLIEVSDLLKMLKSVEKTIKFLRIEQTAVDNEGLRAWPQLEFQHLTTLHLLEPVPFPQNVSSVFPVLEKLRLDQRDGRVERKNIVNCLWKEPLPSVKCLEFCRYLSPDEDIMTLAALFPNVETIRVDYSKYAAGDEDPSYGHSKATKIWSVEAFKQLKHLEIIRLPVKLDKRPAHGSEDEYFTLDVFFTGFPEFLVKRLRAQPEILDPTSVATEMARKDQSLISLKGLKKLTVSFVCNDRGDRFFFTQYPTISNVTAQYALNLMHDLDVSFLYDHLYDQDCGHALRPIAQVVPLSHRDYNEPL